MTGRVIGNTLTEAEILENLMTGILGDPAESLSRYGADLLGRAIGHEMNHERRKGLPRTLFYSNLVHQLDHTPTRKVMAFDAARDVMEVW